MIITVKILKSLWIIICHRSNSISELFFLLFVCILLFCLVPFQCFCMFVFFCLFYILSMLFVFCLFISRCELF